MNANASRRMTMPKGDGYDRTIEGHLATLSKCRHRCILLLNAHQAIASGASDPIKIARDAIEADNEIRGKDETKENFTQSPQ